ncbi:exported hypothetical protein [Mesorhizobium plurifarium]|uniref:Transposase n=1 Tax=Mesorhizobium plurifarium TaxID=69974 RepID=A0A090GMX3_MESPL|nr:exported hypothetical protein [Mesorhizobium plurifarium]
MMLLRHHLRSSMTMLLAAGSAQEMAVAGACHPARSRQMTVMNATGALRLFRQIDAEQDFDHLAPVRAVVGRIKQARIELDVLAIVFGQFVCGRRGLIKRFDHLWPHISEVKARILPIQLSQGARFRSIRRCDLGIVAS